MALHHLSGRDLAHWPLLTESRPFGEVSRDELLTYGLEVPRIPTIPPSLPRTREPAASAAETRMNTGK